MSAFRPAPAIPPYWQCFAGFFAFPLRGRPLLRTLALTLLPWLAMWLDSIFSLVPLLIYLVALPRYGFAVIERTARGQLHGDSPLDDSQRINPNLPYYQALYFVLGGAVMLLMALLGELAVEITALALLLLYPANTMLLAIEQNLASSLNPAALYALARRIGLPYLGLCGCLLLLSGGSASAVERLEARVSPALLAMLGAWLTSYFAVVTYRLLGYVLYQYHHELGIDLHPAASTTHAQPGDSAAEIATLLSHGEVEQALALARTACAEQPEQLAPQERLIKLLAALPEQHAELAERLPRLMQMLLQQQRHAQALRILDRLLTQLPEFRYPDPDSLIRLAQAAYREHRHKLAWQLLQGFEQRFGKHRELPRAWLLSAQLLCEYRGQDKLALRLLELLAERYPQHPVQHEAAELRAFIARLHQADQAL